MTLPCQQAPEDWYSDDATVRADAAAQCRTCPAIDRCAELGAGEVWGVWAAEDKELTLLEGMPAEVVVPHSRSAYNAKAHGDCAHCAEANRQFIARWRAKGRLSQVPDAGHEQLDLFGRTA